MMKTKTPLSQNKLRALVAVSALWAVAGTMGCGDPEPIPFTVNFSVRADEKLPVTNAQIKVRGKSAGTTDSAGEISVLLKGFEGDRLPIGLECPEGYAPKPAESIVILRTIVGLSGEERRPITHDLGCQPTKRDAVVLVHVGGQATSLPVKIDGAVVGQTDSLGFAHIHLRTDPGSRFEISLDTSANDKLMPQNPRQQFQVTQSDDVFVFDKSFKLPAPPKVKKRRPVKPAVHVPIRLD